MKEGALCECPYCNETGLDLETNILLSEHNLSELELNQIAKAVRAIYETGLDEDTRFHALVYFLSRKWPKLITCEIGLLDADLRRWLDGLYRSRLAHLNGQETAELRVSPILQDRWTRPARFCLSEEEEWKGKVPTMCLTGRHLAEDIIQIMLESGHGTIKQKISRAWNAVSQILASVCNYEIELSKKNIRESFLQPNYSQLLIRATCLLGDVQEYRRNIDLFCAEVKNGWSYRTQAQCGYFLGACFRLEEMAECCKTLMEHSSGKKVLIKIDVERTRQEFFLSQKHFEGILHVVFNPSAIRPEVVQG